MCSIGLEVDSVSFSPVLGDSVILVGLLETVRGVKDSPDKFDMFITLYAQFHHLIAYRPHLLLLYNILNSE